MSMWTEADARAAKEAAAALGAALVASYVRAKQDGHLPWWKRAIVRTAEGVVATFLAIGLAGFMEWSDPRTTMGVACLFGYLGMGVISDMLVKWLGKRVEKA